MKEYRGYIDRTTDDAKVDIYENDVKIGPLHNRMDVFRHSPDGYSWGYGGSGPHQLAGNLLMHMLGGNKAAAEIARQYYHQFVNDFLCKVDMAEPIEIREEDVRQWLAKQAEVKAQQ